MVSPSLCLQSPPTDKFVPVFTFVPDMSKARGAAADIVALLDSTPDIDADRSTGTMMEKCDGHIKFNSESHTFILRTRSDALLHRRPLPIPYSSPRSCPSWSRVSPSISPLRASTDIRPLSLEVKPGQFIAIVGPSGCGKSTLIQLVERFYDPLSGTVTVDGQDISEFQVQSYRQSISLVSQEPTLYAGSVRFNITLGATIPADQVSQADIEQACKDAK
jgi:ATP-binding cassette subfamily B (MDR/TAP) protein 1